MKKKLNELLLCQFIDLVCGDCTVLLGKDKNVDDDTLKKYSSEILLSYRQITDNVNLKIQLMEKEDVVKSKARILILRICNDLVANKSYDEVRTLLGTLDESVDGLDDEDLPAMVDGLLNIALFEQHRNEDMRTKEKRVEQSPEDIRASFYAEIAFMMTYFKMNIDINAVNAEIYANMVHQADVAIRNSRVKT